MHFRKKDSEFFSQIIFTDRWRYFSTEYTAKVSSKCLH